MKLAREVANARIVLDNELPSKQAARHQTNAVIDEAKRLQRLQTRRAKLRKELRQVDKDIRHSKRMLKALAGGK